MAQKINQSQYGVKYSTSEQVTGDVWIDGKPIYRKTISLGSLPNNAAKTVAHSITGIGTVVALYGVASTSTEMIPLNLTYPLDGLAGIGVYMNTTNIVVVAGSNRTAYTAYATVEYTKT